MKILTLGLVALALSGCVINTGTLSATASGNQASLRTGSIAPRATKTLAPSETSEVMEKTAMAVAEVPPTTAPLGPAPECQSAVSPGKGASEHGVYNDVKIPYHFVKLASEAEINQAINKIWEGDGRICFIALYPTAADIYRRNTGEIR